LPFREGDFKTKESSQLAHVFLVKRKNFGGKEKEEPRGKERRGLVSLKKYKVISLLGEHINFFLFKRGGS